ncbi:MAG: hypothetical protein AAF388_28335 [Bacteroidota bacterium]
MSLFQKVPRFLQKTLYLLPVIYLVFSFLGNYEDSFLKELLYGLPFLLLGLYYQKVRPIPLLLFSFLYLSHAIYDFFSESLVHNTGVPFLYRELCILYDVLAAGVLLYAYFLQKRENPLEK